MGKYVYFVKGISFFTLFFCVQIFNAQNPKENGLWGGIIPFEIVPVAVANLPDGRLITWSSQFPNTFVSSGNGFTYTQIFDPLTDVASESTTTQTDHDMFCPGLNNLSDGRILSAGGTTSQRTSIYDPITGMWTAAANMNVPRGYQGNVTLSDGSVFTVGGSWDVGPDGAKTAELWTPDTGWVYLSGIDSDDFLYNSNDQALESQGLFRLDNHVWLWPAPNGKLFQAGPGEMMHWIDVEGNNGAGAVVSAGQRGNDTYSIKGTTVMFDIGKILKVGGSRSYDSGTPAKERSFVIDINDTFGSEPTVTETANTLTFARTMHNSTVLPNGEVLVTGGLDHAETFTDTGAALVSEIYNPVTNSWRTVAGMATPRTYHSVAILMLDGRVFVGGGGLCDSTPGCENHANAEIYSPPYLFDTSGNLATRPEIVTTPETADYNATIEVTADAGINGFNLIRFSAATHSTNNEQRRIPISFTDNGNGNYSLNIPERNLLPPGYYMLFAMDANDVPSVAKAIKIGSDIPLATDPSLLLDLRFDETNGATAVDDSQYSNNGLVYDVDDNRTTKVQNTTSWNNGLFGGALETDGFKFQSNTIVDIPYSESLARAKKFITIMAWVNRDEIVNNASIFSHDYPSMFFGFHNSLFKWEFTAEGGRASCYAGYTPVSEWVHMAATYDGKTARLYANGIEICSDITSGEIRFNSSEPDFSSFSVSGFYQRGTNPSQDYNGSGVTDELDGKIDDLKVFNKALSPSEIFSFYEIGTALPEVSDCTSESILPEYKVGVNGTWTQGSNINTIEGDQVFIRAKNFTEQYFITTPLINGKTFDSASDFDLSDGYQIDTNTNNGDNDGQVDPNNTGRYVLTTSTGCIGVIDLNVVGVCGPEDQAVIPEYRINGTWQSGDTNLQVNEGTELVLSMLPNNISVSITLPDGTVVGDDYDLGSVTSQQSGTYIISAENGCSEVFSLSVVEFNCNPGDIIPEYRLDGVWQSGLNDLTVDMGTEVMFSMLPNGMDVTVTFPDGTVVGDDYNIGPVDESHSGAYTVLSSAGCSTVINLTVSGQGCQPGDIVPEYTIEGVTGSGAASVTLDEGQELILSMLPDGIGLTIMLPDGSLVGDNHNLGNVVPSQSGTYTFTSEDGCVETLDIQIIPADNCNPRDIIPEYRLDGVWQSGLNDLTVDMGTEVMFSMLPNGMDVTVTFPDGTVVGDDYNIGPVDASHSGAYTVLSSEGCSTVINLTVGGQGCQPGDIVPEYTIDGVTGSGAASITVDEEQELILSMLPDGIGLTIMLPDGSLVGDNHNLGNVVPSQSGTYTFTSEDGCVETLDVQIIPADNCNPGDIIPEYTIDSVTGSGAASITVDEGQELILSMLPDGIGLTIMLPDGSLVGDNHNLGNVVPSQSGTYTFTSADGCVETLDIQIIPADNCNPGDIIPEYRLDGVWSSGLNNLTVDYNTVVMFSMLPNGIGLTVTFPDGTVVGDDYNIGRVTPANNGTYILTSAAGCQTTINLTVNDNSSCPEGSIIPEYRLDGSWSSGLNDLAVNEGTEVMFSMLPNKIGVTIELPDGTLVGDDYNLGPVTPANNGPYLLTSSEGCQTTINLLVASTGKTTLPDQATDLPLNNEVSELRPSDTPVSVVYPNPTKGILNIGLELFMDQRVTASVFDSGSRTVFTKNFGNDHGTQEVIDLGNLPDGLYYLVLENTLNRKVHSILVRK